MPKTAGQLIVIDGIDGSGKATQAKLLVSRFKKLGRMVASFDFPQYQQNFFGQMVGDYLHGKFGPVRKINPYLASVLYAADRWETKEKMINKLNQGCIVVLDRYTSANQIHQASKIKDIREQNRYLKWLEQMEYKIFKIPRPDLVFFLHLPIDIVCDLIENRIRQKDSHEKDTDHLKNALSMALKLSKKYKNWHKIDCSHQGKILSRQTIADKIWQKVKQKLEN